MNYQFILLRYCDSNFEPTKEQQNAIRDRLYDMAKKDDRAVLLEIEFVDGGVNFLLNTTIKIKYQHIDWVSKKLIDDDKLPYVEEKDGGRRVFEFHERLWIELPISIKR